MKKLQKLSATSLLLMFYVFTLLTPGAALASCPESPRDVSVLTQGGNRNNCGDTVWELEASFDGTVYDDGSEDIQGTCTGNYYNCSCTLTGPGYKTGTKTLYSEVIDFGDGNKETDWYWNIKSYTGLPSYSLCGAGNGPCVGVDPNGPGYYKSESDPTSMSEAGYDGVFYSCVF